MSPDKNAIGQRGEEAAEKFLKAHGFRILERNWRSHPLELDIVAEQGDTLVFVEVKTRAADGLTQPHEALTGEKRKRLVRAAARYLTEYGLWERPCRFDLISVAMNTAGKPDLEHIPNAFDLSSALARTTNSRHAAWQPW